LQKLRREGSRKRMEYNGGRERLFEHENNLKGEENLDTLD